MTFEFQIRALLSISIWTVLSTHPAWAEDHSLQLKAETSLTFDNNLFRLPASANPTLILGKPSGAEQIGINTLSLNFSTSLSLQKINLTVSIADSLYQNFSYLNYTSYNYNAELKWSLTPKLHGILSSNRKETANSFSDYLGLNQSNLRTEMTTRMEAIYEVDGPWRVLSGVSQFSQINQQALVAGGDHTTQTVEAGLGYVFASGSNISFRQKAVSGHFLNRVLPSSGAYDTDFSKAISDLRAQWVMPDNSSADFYLSTITQTHPNFPQRNFSGLNSGASINWLLTGKSSVKLGQSRDVSAYAVFLSNYTQTDRLYFSPIWQLSPKSLVILKNEWAHIAYQGAPNGIGISNQRNDETRDTSLSFYWQPDQRLTFSAALQNASRASNQTGLDYNSNQISVSAQYSY